MRLLITGGAGFIGSQFVRHILKCYPSYRVTNLDKLTYAGNMENLRGVVSHSRHRFVKGDICNRLLVRRLAKDADAIINFAAETHVDRSIRRPTSFLQTDIIGTNILLEAARHYRHDRYVQISTDEVYGSVAKGQSNERAQVSPSNPYSASKAGADLLVLAYRKTYGLPVLISRCCNNYGSYQHPEKLIPLLITNALLGQPLPLYGDGLYRRDWIHVRDHCAAIDRILHHGIVGEVYNIGSGPGSRNLTNLQIANGIVRRVGCAPSLIQFVQDRPGHDRRYALDDSKLRRLGYRPAISWREGLTATVRWYEAHNRWWERIRVGDFHRYYQQHYSGNHRVDRAVATRRSAVTASRSRKPQVAER